MVGITVHGKEEVWIEIFYKPAPSQKDVPIKHSAAFENLAPRTVNRGLNSPEFISCLSSAVIGNHGFLSCQPHYLSRYNKLSSRKSQMKKRYQKFTTFGSQVGACLALVKSNEVKHLPIRSFTTKEKLHRTS